MGSQACDLIEQAVRMHRPQVALSEQEHAQPQPQPA